MTRLGTMIVVFGMLLFGAAVYTEMTAVPVDAFARSGGHVYVGNEKRVCWTRTSKEPSHTVGMWWAGIICVVGGAGLVAGWRYYDIQRIEG